MGAWGTGPFDNDDAADFWDRLRDSKNPTKEIDKALRGYEGERRAAAAFLRMLLKCDLRSLQRQKKDAIRVLKEFKEDGIIEIIDQKINILDQKALELVARHG